MSASLLDPAFVRELEALRRRLVVRAPSGGAGEHRSRRAGASSEFHAHRAYEPGDDLRRIDWAAYARSGEPVLKLFRAEEDTVVRLVLDVSASLAGDKLARVQRVAAALGYVGLCSGERVSVQVFVPGERASGEQNLWRGRAQVPRMLGALEALEARGTTALAAAVNAATARGRPGMLAVLSDFLDEGPWQQALQRARAAGHDLALVQVLTRDELDPTLEGDWLLEDSETGRTVDLGAEPEALAAYRSALAGLCSSVHRVARAAGGVYVRTPTDEALEPPVRRVLSRQSDASVPS